MKDIGLIQATGKTHGLMDDVIDLASSGIRFLVDGKKIEITDESLSDKEIEEFRSVVMSVRPDFLKADPRVETLGFSKCFRGILLWYKKLIEGKDFKEIAVFINGLSESFGIEIKRVKLGKNFEKDRESFEKEGFGVVSENQEIYLRFEEIQKMFGEEHVLDILKPGKILVTGGAMSYGPKLYSGLVSNIVDNFTIMPDILEKLMATDKHKLFYPLFLLSNKDFLCMELQKRVREATGVELRLDQALMFTTTGGSNPGLGIHYKGTNYSIELKSLEKEIKIDGEFVEVHCKKWIKEKDPVLFKEAMDLLLKKMEITSDNAAQYLKENEPLAYYGKGQRLEVVDIEDLSGPAFKL